MSPREKRRIKKKEDNLKLKNNSKNKEVNYQNYLLTITYDGSNFGGYAKQKFANTIEETLFTNISEFLNEDIKLIEASRTDAKVHAIDQKVMFKSKTKFKEESFLKEVNSRFKDIEILEIKKVSNDFHSRYDVLNKTYIYKVHTKRNIFLNKYSYFIDDDNLNIDKINKICNLFLGTHDFIGFSSSKRDSKNTIRTINTFRFKKIDNNNFVFEINSDGFLYNMIRILIPTVLDCYYKELSKEQILNILNSLNRESAQETISPCGLYLKKINYKG